MEFQQNWKDPMTDLKKLLDTWKNNILNSEFHYMSTLNAVIEIIEPITEDLFNFHRFFLHPNGFDLFHSNKFHYMRKLLHKEKKNIRQLLHQAILNTQNDNNSMKSQDADVLLSKICHFSYLIYPAAVGNLIKSSDINFVSMLFTWAQKNDFLLCYSTVLLSRIMNDDIIAEKYYNENEKLISTLFAKLRKLFEYYLHCSDIQYNHEININAQQISYMEAIKLQVYFFRYLSTVNDRKVLLKLTWKYNIMDIFLQFLNTIQANEKDNENHLSETLYCLSLYLKRQEFGMKFIAIGGLEKLLQLINDKKIASRGIALCLMSLSFSEKVMKYICRKKKNIIPILVSSVLWLLNNQDIQNNYVEICSILKFFEFSFAYRIIVEKFDELNGLQLFELVINPSIDKIKINTYKKLRKCREKLLAWQKVRCFCKALNAYWKTHLYWCAIKNEKLQLKQCDRKIKRLGTLAYYPCHLTDKETDEKIEFLMTLPRTSEFTIAKQYYSFHLFFVPTWILKIECVLPPYINVARYANEIAMNCINITKLSLLDDNIISLIFDETEERRLSTVIESFMNNISCRFDQCIIENGFQIISNLLWTHIYRFNINNSEQLCLSSLQNLEKYNAYISTGRRHFYEIIIKMSGKSLTSYFSYCLTGNNIETKYSLRILIALAFVQNIKTIFHSDRIFCHTFTKTDLHKLILNEDTDQILRKHAMEFANFIENNPKIYDKKYKETENLTMTLLKRSEGSKVKLNGNYFYRKFRASLRITSNYQDDDYITSCIYSPCGNFLYTGANNGLIEMYNAHTGVKTHTEMQCDSSTINSMDIHKCNNLLLANDEIWNPTTLAHRTLGGLVIDYSQFTKLQDKIIGSFKKHAAIYDVETGKMINHYLSFSSSDYGIINKVTCSMDDGLLLSDCKLWDLKSNKKIHRFETLHSFNGVFHPRGNELIFSEYVYDLRTFELLKIIPDLIDTSVTFSPLNNIFHSYDDDKLPETNQFHTYNSLDYSLISTYDIGINITIEHMTCHPLIPRVAIVENFLIDDDIISSVIQCYDAGMDNSDNP